MINFDKDKSEKSKKKNFFTDNFSTSKITTVCRMRSIETNVKIKKITNIVKIDVVKTKISHEQTKKSENSNFSGFSKINCFKCRQKKYYVRDRIVLEFTNKSKKI